VRDAVECAEVIGIFVAAPTRGSDGLAQGILTLKKEFGRDLKTRTKALDMILVQLPPHQFLRSDWTEHESIEKGINTFGCV